MNEMNLGTAYPNRNLKRKFWTVLEPFLVFTSTSVGRAYSRASSIVAARENARPTIWLFLGIVVFAAASHAVSPTPDELGENRRWVAAKFQGSQQMRPMEPGLWVLANYDPVQKNARAGRPMRIANTEFTRGLYCHAFSKIIVRLPEAGGNFTAICGVDSNEQTSGGRGSVDFSVSVGGAEKFRSGVMRESMAGKPVKVDLGAATEFVLQISETPDGILATGTGPKRAPGRWTRIASWAACDQSRTMRGPRA